MKNDLKNFLDAKVAQYNQPAFIKTDPVSIPHLFTKLQDREIAGFFAAVFSWGNRTTIIQKCKELLQLLHHAPHDFVLRHTDSDLMKLLHFRHRTFNATDLLYFIEFFKWFYSQHVSLEEAFLKNLQPGDASVEHALLGFHELFFSLEHPERTRKHISTPAKHSACKRLNMFLRWMVRTDENGVDFGAWKGIRPSQLVCPLDVHVARVAKRFGLLPEVKANWQTARALTNYLRILDPDDPVKYDFALFGLGVMEKYV